MAAPVAQKMSADFNVNGCIGVSEGRKEGITTEENTHASAVEGFGLLYGSRVAE